jgi:hypothetical protein
MAIILNTSIDLTKIPKEKIVEGKKGKYLPITITVNNEKDNFGNDGPVIVAQTQDERTNKQAKTYLGNVKVIWTDGKVPEPAPRGQQAQGGFQQAPAQSLTQVQSDDLPF